MSEIHLMGVSQISGQECVVREANGMLVLAAGHAVLAHMHIGEANLRIRLPSFFTTRYISIDSDSGETLFFEAKSQATRQISDLLDRCAGIDPAGTAAAYRARANRDFLIGVAALVIGAGITAASFYNAGPQGTFYVMTGLLGLGAIEMIRGVYFTIQASRQG